MKTKVLRATLALCVSACMISGMAATVLAEETELTETAEASVIEIDVNGETVEAADETDLGLTLVSVEQAEAEAETEEEAQEASDLWVLTLTDSENNEYVIEDVELGSLSELSFTERLGFVYLNAQKDGSKVVLGNNVADADFDEAVTMYTISRVNIREEASADAEVVVIAGVNTEVEVLGGTADWFHVVSGEDEGYMASRYLTLDADEAAAAQAKAEEEAAAAAAAQAAAAAAAASSGSSGGSTGGGGSNDACLTGGVLN